MLSNVPRIRTALCSKISLHPQVMKCANSFFSILDAGKDAREVGKRKKQNRELILIYGERDSNLDVRYYQRVNYIVCDVTGREA